MPVSTDPIRRAEQETDAIAQGLFGLLGVCIELMDSDLDGKVATDYKDQPLAQDWARISKVIEELGETIAELILFTGQNPRKERDPQAGDRMLDELMDVALTAIYGAQHFCKNTDVVLTALARRALYHCERRGFKPDPFAFVDVSQLD